MPTFIVPHITWMKRYFIPNTKNWKAIVQHSLNA